MNSSIFSRVFVMLVLVALSSLATADVPGTIGDDDETWLIYQPPGVVSFQGVVSFDQAGLEGGSMMYPAPSVGGFLAAVLVHGAVAGSMRQRQKDRLQEEADQVLDSYRAVLDEFQYAELLPEAIMEMESSGVKEALDGIDASSPGWLMLIEPVFSMTQDQRTFVLDNTITIFAPDNRDEHAYRNHVRVTSIAVETDDPIEHWTSTNGMRLKAQSATLLAQSLDIAIEDANGLLAGDVPYRTHRYMEGEQEKIERAQLVAETCDMMLLRTLRGWLYYVPRRRNVAEVDADLCGEMEAATASDFSSG